MKGKFTALKVIGLILAVLGIAVGILGAVFGLQKYSINPADARNSVVWIKETLSVPELKAQGAWAGTGWAVGTPGEKVKYIVTNGHVVEQAYAWPKGLDDPFDYEAKNGISFEKALKEKTGKSLSELKMKTEIRVYFSQSSNDYSVPEVVYFSGPSEKDIAILKLEEPTNKRIALLIKNSDQVQVGEEATALGFPGVSDNVQDPETINHGVDDVTVTKGIISKRVKPNQRDYDSFQMDASINHGNSGGPLVDKNGYVIGMNTLGNAKDSNMNYAIVSNEIIDVLNAERIGYQTSALKNPALLSLIVVGILMLAGGIIMLVIPSGKKTAATGAVAGAAAGMGAVPQPQAGVNPYAAAQQRPVAQGYPQQAAAPVAAAGVQRQAPSQPAAVQGQGRPVLKCIKGQFAGKAFDLSRGKVILGRDPASCNLVFNKETPGISSKHCQMSYDAASGSFILTDLGSSYGTYTGNGKKLEPNVPERLAAGDVFYLADENVKFQINKD
ncbi:MAG: trypsin-like peptidase domain-containing protein [Saccharofermentans sp.]|nr:trypsin-like peptidase domain-containing protein [Saccharofermentans sp.]